MRTIILSILTLITLQVSLFAGPYYKVESISPPAGVTLEVGGMKIHKNGSIYMCTRQGDVFIYNKGEWSKFAEGLQEPLGLVLGKKDGEVYVLQRPELTLLKDEDGDGAADLFKCINDDWGFTGNYHEYAMGLIQDKYGNFYAGLGLPFSKKQHNRFRGQWLGTIDVKERGWYFKITPKGEYVRVAPGVREPVGGVISDEGDIFISDTQGSYVATNYIIHVGQGEFLGHPDSLLWDESIKGKVDALTKMKDEERNAELNKMRKRPAVYIPYRIMGMSVGSMQYDRTGGKFGPYAGQMIVADVIQNLLMRATLERVDGQFQGAIYKFYNGTDLGGGSHKMEFDKEGNLWVGQTARGWGSGHGLKKLTWTGKTPFDVKEVKLTQKGFRFHFTEAVNRTSVNEMKNFQIKSSIYQYTNIYTAKMTQGMNHDAKLISISADGKTVDLEIPGLRPDSIVEIRYPNIRSKSGQKPQFNFVYYTLNRLQPNYLSQVK